MQPDDPNHLYLDRATILDLADLLREIPGVAADLEDAVTCRARPNAPNHRLTTRSSDQPLPFNPAAARARDHLHSTLVSWVRLVCEQRGIDYAGSPTTAALARWLDRHLIAFAMTEGVEAAPAELRSAVAAALRIICPPPAQITVDPNQIEAARRINLTVTGIVTLAKELGTPFGTLTVRRIQTLRDADKIAPVPGPWARDWPEQFTVGKVLDAHLEYPIRKRKPTSAASNPREPLLKLEVPIAG